MKIIVKSSNDVTELNSEKIVLMFDQVIPGEVPTVTKRDKDAISASEDPEWQTGVRAKIIKEWERQGAKRYVIVTAIES